MSSFWWTLLTLLVAAFTQVKGQSTAFPVIPKHLLECYKDPGIFHRANRMPNTLDTFLDLLKKVEDSPTSRNLNARELASVLLHYVKLDGIQSIASGTKYFPDHIIPAAPSGAEYFKHRLTLVGLVPKIDAGYQSAFNETLTTKEMCNLHFMLSYSIDPYKRPDESCTFPLEEYNKGMRPEPRSDWDPYHNSGGYYRRSKRHIDRGEHLNELGATDGKTLSKQSSSSSDSDEMVEMEISEYLKKREIEESRNPRESGRSLHRRSVSDDQNDKKLEVEEIPVPQHTHVEKKLEEKDKFTIGDQELLSADGQRPRAGMQSLIQRGTFGRAGGRGYAKPTQIRDDTLPVYTGVVPGIPLSECPVVNGVINTPSGSLTVGTVIAGIAAGLNPEDIPPRRLSVEPEELESPSDRIKNVWGATLAGTVADTISSSAILDDNSLQILKGGWNETVNPKWYLLKTNQFKHLPEVTLRGSLDGLYLGVNAKEWTSRFPGFKLSQMLEVFYSCCWGGVGAKNRIQQRPQYAPDEMFRKQTLLMALVMKKQKTNDFTVLDYKHVSRDAVARVIQHIHTMDVNEKSYIGSFFSTKIKNTINMIAVIDSSWGHENLIKIFEDLRTAQTVNVVGSNLTIVCGKDGRTLLSTTNSVDLYNRFTKDMLFENCTRGMDLPLVFDTLDTRYRKIFYDEKMSQKMNTDAQVTVLFPFEPLPRDNSYIKEKSKNFRSCFPDVRLIIATNGAPESFLDLVNSPKDLFPLVAYSDQSSKYSKEFAEGVKQSYQRLSRPSCGSYFDDDSVGVETRVTRDVGIGNIAYYRLLPQYFFKQSGEVTITIRSKMRSPLVVCHSRKTDRPAGVTPREIPDYNPNRNPEYNPNRNPEYNPNRSPEYNFDRNPEYRPDFPPEASPYDRQINGDTDEYVQCKTITGEPYKIEMTNPCQGASNLRECDPLYISMSPPHQDSVSITCPTCPLPTDVQFEITVSGLTCYNSAAIKLVSPVLLCILLIHYSLKLYY